MKRIILFLFLAAKILLASKTRDLYILLHDYILGRLSTRVKVNTMTSLACHNFSDRLAAVHEAIHVTSQTFLSQRQDTEMTVGQILKASTFH